MVSCAGKQSADPMMVKSKQYESVQLTCMQPAKPELPMQAGNRDGVSTPPLAAPSPPSSVLTSLSHVDPTSTHSGVSAFSLTALAPSTFLPSPVKLASRVRRAAKVCRAAGREDSQSRFRRRVS